VTAGADVAPGPDESGAEQRARRELVVSLVRDVPDYPTAGILFKDITPVLADPAGLRAAVEGMSALLADVEVDVVAGVEARGFVLGTPLALAAGTGFVPVRKAGKLPTATRSVTYALEYGTAQIEVHADAFTPGQRVAVVDDLLATGGTAAAACELVEAGRAEVVAVVFLLELGFLSGRERLSGRDVRSLAIL
jgi:adenine phosphoribosyltransferase